MQQRRSRAGNTRGDTLDGLVVVADAADPGSVRREVLRQLMERAEADAALYYRFGMVDGQRRVVSMETCGHPAARDMAENLAAHSTAENHPIDVTLCTPLERRAFVELAVTHPQWNASHDAAYRRFMEPYGFRFQQRLLAFHGRRFVGWVGVLRRLGSQDFGPASRRRLHPLVARTITALTHAVAVEEQRRPNAVGDVILRPDGTVEYASHMGQLWLGVPGMSQALRDAVLRGAADVAANGARARLVRMEAPGVHRYVAYVQPAHALQLSPLSSLSMTQQRVAVEAAAGATLEEIARSLEIGVETARSHLRSVYLRLEVGSRVELARALLDGVSRENA